MPDGQTRLVLVRHAPVDTGPPPGCLCGWLDLPLSPAGRAMLDGSSGRWRAYERPDALYTSTLRRARDVAIVLGGIWETTPICDDALREINCGVLEGARLDWLQAEYPDLWARNTAQDDDDFRWPGGESYRSFRERVLGGLSRIAARHAGGRVVVVTHAGVVAQVLGTIRGRRPAAWEPDRPEPLAATEVTWADGSPLEFVSRSER